jgi:hypothetical protein
MLGHARLAALAVLVALPAAADEPPPALIEATEEAFAQCRELGGVPAILSDYQTVRDLNGDGRDDFLTDLAHLQCAGAWTAFCGSAGCPVTAWLSGPDGYTRFDFGYLQGVEVRDGAGPLPEVVAYYHGTRCDDDRVGAEGCTRTWTFASNAPDEPPVDAPAPAPEAARAATAEELPPGWTLREVPGSSPVALAGGPGNIASLAAFCLADQPFLAVTFRDRPAADQVDVDFGFSPAVEAPAGFEETAGGAFVIALADLPLASRLAGRDSEVAVEVDAHAEGILSLKGSTRTLRAALRDCYRF